MTPQQHRFMEFVRAYWVENGHGPNYDEIAAHLGLSSKSGIYRMAVALQRDGRLEPSRFKSARSLVPTGMDRRQAAADRIVHMAVEQHGVDDEDGTLIVFSADTLRTLLLTVELP